MCLLHSEKVVDDYERVGHLSDCGTLSQINFVVKFLARILHVSVVVNAEDRVDGVAWGCTAGLALDKFCCQLRVDPIIPFVLDNGHCTDTVVVLDVVEAVFGGNGR